MIILSVLPLGFWFGPKDLIVTFYLMYNVNQYEPLRLAFYAKVLIVKHLCVQRGKAEK
jgi:hypothetical protein